MKSILFAFLFAGLTVTAMAQNDIAQVDIPTESSPANYTSSNTGTSHYAEKSGWAEKVVKFQNLVAQYDIKQEPVFSEEGPSQYIVEFYEDQNKVVAYYDQSGDVVRSKARYKDIRLPKSINKELSRSHTGWAIVGNTVTIQYNQDGTVDSCYKVMLEKDGESDVVKIKRTE